MFFVADETTGRIRASCAAEMLVGAVALETPDGWDPALQHLYRVLDGQLTYDPPADTEPYYPEAAHRLATPRQIGVSGDAVGAAMFDGSENVDVCIAVEAMTNEDLRRILQ